MPPLPRGRQIYVDRALVLFFVCWSLPSRFKLGCCGIPGPIRMVLGIVGTTGPCSVILHTTTKEIQHSDGCPILRCFFLVEDVRGGSSSSQTSMLRGVFLFHAWGHHANVVAELMPAIPICHQSLND